MMESWRWSVLYTVYVYIYTTDDNHNGRADTLMDHARVRSDAVARRQGQARQGKARSRRMYYYYSRAFASPSELRSPNQVISHLARLDCDHTSVVRRARLTNPAEYKRQASVRPSSLALYIPSSQNNFAAVVDSTTHKWAASLYRRHHRGRLQFITPSSPSSTTLIPTTSTHHHHASTHFSSSHTFHFNNSLFCLYSFQSHEVDASTCITSSVHCSSDAALAFDFAPADAVLEVHARWRTHLSDARSRVGRGSSSLSFSPFLENVRGSAI